MTLTGWTKLEQKYDGKKYKAKQDAVISAAMAKLGVYVSGRIKREIQGGGYARNAAFTTLAKKGSTAALFDSGQLMQAVTWRPIKKDTIFVGILRSARGKGGTILANVAATIHEGTTITVTPRMRNMFWYLSLVSRGRMPEGKLTGRAKVLWKRLKAKRGEIRPLGEATTEIRIPKRPFMKAVFDSPDVRRYVYSTYTRAIDTALRL